VNLLLVFVGMVNVLIQWIAFVVCVTRDTHLPSMEKLVKVYFILHLRSMIIVLC